MNPLPTALETPRAIQPLGYSKSIKVTCIESIHRVLEVVHTFVVYDKQTLKHNMCLIAMGL